MPQQCCLPQLSLPAKPSEAYAPQAGGLPHRHPRLLYNSALNLPSFPILPDVSPVPMHRRRAVLSSQHICSMLTVNTQGRCQGRIPSAQAAAWQEHASSKEARPIAEAFLWLWLCRARCSSSAFRSSVSYSSLSCLTLSKRLWHSCSALSTSSADRPACTEENAIM